MPTTAHDPGFVSGAQIVAGYVPNIYIVAGALQFMRLDRRQLRVPHKLTDTDAKYSGHWLSFGKTAKTLIVRLTDP